MEIVNGYELITEWKNSNCGKTARAKRGGKIYFLKKYQTPVEPVDNGALDAKTIAKNKANFDKFVARRRKVNTALRSIAGAGGNLIVPADEFIDDHHYVEAAEFVEGAVNDEDTEAILDSLSVNVKKLLMLTASGALASVHKLGIVHSDLKLKNILLVKNPAGNYVAKIIDFDSSYFADDVPEEVVGDINFFSPELGNYSNSEDDREEYAKNLTTKSDIFSLGVIFHKYLSTEYPDAKELTPILQKRRDKGKAIYCWVMVKSGCELKLSDKITDLNQLSLIRDMLSLDPANRPSASDVLKRLKETESLNVFDEPWPEDRITLKKDALTAKGFVGAKKVVVGTAKKYALITSDGVRTEKTKDELIAEGLAKIMREEKFAEPWEDHNIKFVEAKLRACGYVASERKELSGVKGYEFFKADDSSMFFTKEKLLHMKFAEKLPPKAPPVSDGFCEPWPEHHVAFDEEQIRKKGFVRSEQAVLGGVKGYNFIKADGTKQFINMAMTVMLKLATKL